MSRAIIKVRKHQSIANTNHSPAASNKRSFSMLHKGSSPYLHKSPSHMNVQSNSPGRKKKITLTSVRKIRKELSSESEFLQVRLQQKLKALEGKGSFIIEDKMMIYQQIFDQVIEKDRNFGGLLKIIKEGYDDWCKQKNLPLYQKLINDFEQTIRGLNLKIQSLYKQNKRNTQHFKKVAIQNYQLAKKLQDRDKSLAYFQKNWKKLLNESKKTGLSGSAVGVRSSQSQKVSHLNSIVKSYQLKQKKLIAFILLLKQNGCPVQQIYNQKFRADQIIEDQNLTSFLIPVSPNSVPQLNFSFLKESYLSYNSNDSSPIN